MDIPEDWVREVRRLLFYSAKTLREQYGDIPLAELLEEEEAVTYLNDLLGDEQT